MVFPEPGLTIRLFGRLAHPGHRQSRARLGAYRRQGLGKALCEACRTVAWFETHVVVFCLRR
jgi:hypothetical protein